MGITRRRVADELARRAREAAKTQAAGGGRSHEHDPALDTLLDGVVLRHAVEQLPEPRRSVLTLAYVQDKTHEEISALLGLPIGTVKSHVRRGLVHLRREWRRLPMTHVDEEVLAALAIGDPDMGPADAEHVQSCPTCRAGVAALLRVQSLLRETPASSELERNPDAAVWERIAAATTSDSAADSPDLPSPGPSVTPDAVASAGPREALRRARSRRSVRLRIEPASARLDDGGSGG